MTVGDLKEERTMGIRKMEAAGSALNEWLGRLRIILNEPANNFVPNKGDNNCYCPVSKAIQQMGNF